MRRHEQVFDAARKAGRTRHSLPRRAAGTPIMRSTRLCLALHRGSRRRSIPHGIFGPASPAPRLLELRMKTNLADFIRDTPEGKEANAILRACVHCGFCTATCPTYQLLGDELDGPRGRIYLMKELFEGGKVSREDPAPPGPLPHLPLLRDHLSFRRAVRAAGGHRPQRRRASRSVAASAPEAAGARR